MTKRKNPAAVALGRKGGIARSKRSDISQLNRHAALSMHRKAGHVIKSEQAPEECKVVSKSDVFCKPLGTSDVNVNQASGMSEELTQAGNKAT